jgi:hypothetical protein
LNGVTVQGGLRFEYPGGQYVDGGPVLDVTPQRFGAAGDGTTNDDAAILAAVTFAATYGNGVVFLPKGRYRKTSQTAVPDDVRIVGVGAQTRIIGPGFTLGSRNTVELMSFESATANASIALSFKTDTAYTATTIKDCTFTNLSRGVDVGGTATNASHKRIRVLDCYFTNCTYGIYQTYGQYNVYSRNVFEMSAAQRAVLFNGGSYNQITNNSITGGTTGIIFLYARNVAGTNVLFHNVIAQNTITGVTEESISLDLTGNTAAAVGCFDRDTVGAKAINGSNVDVTCAAAAFSTSGNVFTGYYILMRTGLLAGQAFRVATHLNGNLNVEMNTTEAYPLLTVADEFILCAPFVGNVITGNTILSAGTFAILLYGVCAGNVVANNSVAGASIAIWSLSSVIASTINVTGRTGRAPSENNVVSFNAVRGGSIAFTFNDFGADAYSATVGNELSHNRVLNGKFPLANPLAQTPPVYLSGNGSPENVVVAPIGSLYTRQDGSTSTTLYVKTATGTTSAGWTAK